MDIIGQTFGIAPTNNLNKFSPKGDRNLTLLNFVNQLRERNLVLDFALLDEPNINQGAILMKSRGDISW